MLKMNIIFLLSEDFMEGIVVSAMVTIRQVNMVGRVPLLPVLKESRANF